MTRYDAWRFVKKILKAANDQGPELIADIKNRLGSASIKPDRNDAARSDSRNRSAKRVSDWIRFGIYLLTPDDFDECGRHPLNEIYFLFAKGPKNLLNNPTASILNSRRSKHVAPTDCWLRNTLSAVKEAINEGYTIISSIGSIQYSVVTAASKGTGLILVFDGPIPCMLNEDGWNDFIASYSKMIDMDKTLFVSALGPGISGSGSSPQVLRDRIVGLFSDVIFALDVRSGGNIDRLVKQAQKRNVILRKIEVDSATVPEPINKAVCISANESSQAPAILQGPLRPHISGSCDIRICFSSFLGSWIVSDSNALDWLETADAALFHYTRRNSGPWPGQSYADYVMSLINSEAGSSHTALDAVARMWLEKRIRASGTLIRRRIPVVSFTEVVPDRLSDIQKWRIGFCRWSFERYGVAVKRVCLIEKGARQVIYGSSVIYDDLADNEKFLFQIDRTTKYDWSIEKEWRVKGDLDLNTISIRDLAFLAPTEVEARRLAEMIIIDNAMSDNHPGDL